MDDDQKRKLSEERAAAYAPAPTGGSAMAGLCVAMVALVADFAVSGFYGWEVRDHIPVAAGLVIAGFLAGWAGYKRLARANKRAERAERKALDTDPTDLR